MSTIECPNCQASFDVNPRSPNWSGRIRINIQCEACSFSYLSLSEFPNGVYKSQSKVSLWTPYQNSIHIDEYETNSDEALRFSSCWKTILEHLPLPVHKLLKNSWDSSKGEPHVWLINDRKEWRGTGWAATEPDGKSFYFLAHLMPLLPTDVVENMIVHEIAHSICILAGEDFHTNGSPQSKTMAECIAENLLNSWGHDECKCEAWVTSYCTDDGTVIKLRDKPLTTNLQESNVYRMHAKRQTQFGVPSPVVLLEYFGCKSRPN